MEYLHNKKILGAFSDHILFVLLILIIISCERGNVLHEKYEYVGTSTGRIITFDYVKKKIDNGHKVYSFESCDSPSFFVCLYGDTTLAVPKIDLVVGAKWVVAGTKFKVTEIIITENIKNYVIVSESPIGEKLNIFFNDINGIWGIKLNDWEMYELLEPCGLGCKG